jgi:purine-nucleoside phosphorylase
MAWWPRERAWPGGRVNAHGAEAARAAAERVGPMLGVRAPAAALVLGSGLGDLAGLIERPARVRYADIPGFRETSVAGHRGELIGGMFAGREVLVFAGRLHMYEGHDARVAAFAVRVAHALGARCRTPRAASAAASSPAT